MGWLTDVFGERPKVAVFKKLQPGTEQKKSLLNNISNFSDIAKLGALYRQNLIDQQNALLPGYSATMAKGEAGASKILDVGNELLTGGIPQDVKDQIQRSSAYSSLQGGFGGSGMAHSLTARDLGLTSLDLMKQGASMIGQGGNSAQQWATMARGDIMNPASQFVSPQETMNFDLQNQVLKQQSRQMQYNRAAAPSPGAAGISNTIMGVLGMYLGGGMGGVSGLQQGGKSTAVSSPGGNVDWMSSAMGGSGYPAPGGGYGFSGGNNFVPTTSYTPPNFNYDPNAFSNVSLWGG